MELMSKMSSNLFGRQLGNRPSSANWSVAKTLLSMQSGTENYPTSIFIRNLPVIFLYHAYWFFVAIKRKQLFAYFKGLIAALHNFPKMWRKRKQVLSRKTISNKAFWSKIVDSEREVIKSILRRRKSAGKATWPIIIYMKIFL